LILTFTGVLLMFYYVPAVPRAYFDMKDLQHVVPFGNILRNMHRYGAHAMVFMVMVHMARTFYTSAYKPPREFNWVVGVILLTLTFLLSFSGYLLPWDQLAIWAVTVGTNMARATPLLGHEGPFSNLIGMKIDNDVRFALLGGTTVGSATLLRFYVLHCIAFPIMLTVFIVVHFWRVRRDGYSGDVPVKA
jgi:quinol-cytochrome oxidoreductase complex cytochrome b subunit